MPATSKDELLSVTQKEFDKLSRVLSDVAPDFGLIEDEDCTSIRDILTHRAHWIDLFFGWYRDGQAGRQVDFPAKGYNWGQLREYNAALRERLKDVPLEEAVASLRDRYACLMRFIEESSEDGLYGGPMKGAKNSWTAGRWAEASGASHFRSVSKYILARLRSRNHESTGGVRQETGQA